MNAPQATPARAPKPKFLNEEMIATARAHAAYLEGELNLRGSAVMLRILVADIEAYREAFNGAIVVVKHAGDMLKRQDSDLSDVSRSLALSQLKLSVLKMAAGKLLPLIDRTIAASGTEQWPALVGAAEELRGALELAGAP